MKDAFNGVLTNKERADGAVARDYMPSGVKSVDKSRDSRFKALLKVAFYKTLRKIGVSTTGNIYTVPITVGDFKLYQMGKRVVLIKNDKINYKIGDIIRLREYESESNCYSGREAHFFIKDILDFIPHLDATVYKILTLE